MRNRRRAALVGGKKQAGGDLQGGLVKILERGLCAVTLLGTPQNVTVENKDCEDIDGFELWLSRKHLEKLVCLFPAQKEVFPVPEPPAILSWCHGTAVLSTQFRCQCVRCFPVGEMC